MKRYIIILLIGFSNLILGQESDIESKILDVTCDEEIDAYRFNTRLIKDSIGLNKRIIYFSTTATCCVDFEIESKKTNNNVKINLKEIGIPCDCICAYDFVVQFQEPLNSDTKFFVKNRILEKGISKLKMHKKRYFIFENDTTGFDDENGLRQGFVVYNRKKDLKKIYYKDGVFIKLEITDKKGNVLIEEFDENKMFDY